jgi:hypothetical protein
MTDIFVFYYNKYVRSINAKKFDNNTRMSGIL